MNTSLPYENSTILGNSSTDLLKMSQWNQMFWRVLLYGVGGVCIACAGIVCNIISIVVLIHFRNNSSAPFLLICLAVFDSIYLLSILILECLPIMESSQVINWGYRVLMLPVYRVMYPLPVLAQTWVAYLVVVITIERFLVVAWPFLAYRLCSIKSARLAVATVIVMGILYHIPTYMAFTVRPKWLNKTGKWVQTIVRNDYGSSNIYTQFYEKWLNVSINFVLPFTILLIVNVLMIKFLRKTKAEVSVKRAFSRDEQRLTLMVFCMTSVFFVCELLAALSKIVLASYNSYLDLSIAANRFSAVADTILLINSAINFAIYCVTGRKFRQTFVQLFCRCRKNANIRTAYAITAGLRSKQEYSRSRISSSSSCSKPSLPRRSTTESSLSSISNGTRSSKFVLSSDNINNKLVAKLSDLE